MAGSAATPNSRGFRQKVKSGCRTCKRRKVKCDERWPVCLRCQSSGRKCEGYGVFGGGHQCCNPPPVTTTEPLPSLQVVALQDNESNSFEWYLHRSAKKLPGLYPSDFWNSLLLQASTTEPAIRHALLMLSSAHKEEVSGSASVGKENRDAQAVFTMTQYSKAMGQLRIQINDGGTSARRAPLIACVLLTWSEFLRGHYTSGILHLEHGLRLLQKHLQSLEQLDPRLVCIDGWLITTFTRLMVQAKLFGQLTNVQSIPVHVVDACPKHEVFASIHHARRSLEHIILHAFDLIHAAPEQTFETNRTATQCHLRAALSAWTKIHRTTLKRLPATANFFNRVAYSILLPHSYMATILVETCLAPHDELTYDQHLPIFQKLVSHFVYFDQELFKHGQSSKNTHRDPEETSPNSITDFGWVAPLFFTALKCRDHKLRHTALRLLGITTHKEGIWSAPLAAEVARQIIETEEGSFYAEAKRMLADTSALLPGEDEIIFDSLPLAMRISDIRITLPADRLGTLTLTYLSRTPRETTYLTSRTFDSVTQRWSPVDKLTSYLTRDTLMKD